MNKLFIVPILFTICLAGAMATLDIDFTDPTPLNNSFIDINLTGWSINVTGAAEDVQTCFAELWLDNVFVTNETELTLVAGDPYSCYLEIDPSEQDNLHLDYRIWVNNSTGYVNSTEWRMITYDSTYPTISYHSSNFANNTFINHNLTSFLVNVTGIEPNLDKSWFELIVDDFYVGNDTGDGINYLSCTGTNPYSCSVTVSESDGTDDGIYDIRIWANDSASHENVTGWRRITFDNTNPDINISLSLNNSVFSTTSPVFGIPITITDLYLNYSLISLDDGATNLTVDIVNGSQTIYGALTNQDRGTTKFYNLTVWAVDYAGNQNSSKVFNISYTFNYINYGSLGGTTVATQTNVTSNETIEPLVAEPSNYKIPLLNIDIATLDIPPILKNTLFWIYDNLILVIGGAFIIYLVTKEV